MAKTKYYFEATVGTTTGVVAVTIKRASDNATLPFIPAPLKIYDISVIGSPTSNGFLRILRDGQVVYVTAPYSLLRTDLANKRVERVIVTGTAQNLITFDLLVILALGSGSETVRFAVEVEE
jgi:hypothetical protein